MYALFRAVSFCSSAVAPLDEAERREGGDDAQHQASNRGDRACAAQSAVRYRIDWSVNSIVSESRSSRRVFKKLTGLDERLALGEQEIGMAPLSLPAVGGGRRAAGTKELAIVLQKVSEARPVREQCLVCDTRDWLHPVVMVRQEQPCLDQHIEQPAAGWIDAKRLQRHTARHDRLVLALAGGDQRSQNGRQRGLNFNREAAKVVAAWFASTPSKPPSVR